MAFSKQQVGYFAFIAGLFVAAFVAVAYPALMPVHVYSLGLLGIIIGLLNIEAREVWPYILAAVAFLVASTTFTQTIDALPIVNLLLERFLNALIYIVGPGAFVVSLRIIYEAAKSRESLPHPLKEEKAVAKKAPMKRKR
ncbi:MAG: hypothetical protein QW771_01880 [Candidatus Micrarchaeia archaeon]